MILQLIDFIKIGHWFILRCGPNTKMLLIQQINRLLDIQVLTDFHRDFRLWIIVVNLEGFPLTMLQRSFKGLAPHSHKNLRNEMFLQLPHYSNETIKSHFQLYSKELTILSNACKKFLQTWMNRPFLHHLINTFNRCFMF